MVQLRGLTISRSLIEGSSLDLFLRGLAKKEYINSKKSCWRYSAWCYWWKIYKNDFHLTVCYYRVAYRFHSESTLYSCLNVKELLARNRRHIWSLSNCNEIQTRSNLVRKRTLNHFTKLVECSFTNWAVVGSDPVAVT